MAATYQCNVQGPEGKENTGCGKVFESAVDLPPSARVCPDCTRKQNLEKR